MMPRKVGTPSQAKDAQGKTPFAVSYLLREACQGEPKVRPRRRHVATYSIKEGRRAEHAPTLIASPLSPDLKRSRAR